MLKRYPRIEEQSQYPGYWDDRSFPLKYAHDSGVSSNGCDRPVHFTSQNEKMALRRPIMATARTATR